MTPEQPQEQDTEALPFNDLAPLAPLRPARVVEPLPWHARLWSLASSAVPVGVLALLAGLTWWLVRQSPQTDDAPRQATVSAEPDFEMQRFALRQFDAQGRLRARLEGDTLRHFPATREVEIQQVRLHWDDPDGIAHEAVASEARADDAAKRVDLKGGATVRRLDPASPAEFRSQHLTVFPGGRQVQSSEPVLLMQGGTELRAQAFRYDHGQAMVELKGGVRGVLRATAP